MGGRPQRTRQDYQRSGSTSLVGTRPQGDANEDAHLDVRTSGCQSVGDASSKCKEAGGARDSIIHDENDDEDDADAVSGDDRDDENDAELVLLYGEMDSSEHLMYSKGTVASMFALAVTTTSSTTKWRGRSVAMGQTVRVKLPARCWRGRQREGKDSARQGRGR